MTDNATLQERRRLAALLDSQTVVAMAAAVDGAQNTHAETGSAAANAELCRIYGVRSLLDSQEACEFLDEEARRNRRARGIGWVGLRRSARR